MMFSSATKQPVAERRWKAPTLARCCTGAHALVARLAWVALLAPVAAWSQPALPAVTQTISVNARANVPDLVCEPHRPAPPRTGGSSGNPPGDPLVVPDAEVVDLLEKELTTDSPDNAIAKPARPTQGAGGGIKKPLFQPQSADQPFRMAIWGDSHMAAAFFSAELVRQAGLKPDQVQSAFVPASMNRGGVRLPVRKTCVSPGWRYESAHASAQAADTPGPALVNLYSAEPGANLAWDLRGPGSQARQTRIRLLYQQTPTPIRLALSVDGADEQEVVLTGASGPGVLELAGDAPLSVVKIRLLEGALRFHGMGLDVTNSARLQLDLFGWPGATVAGWRQSGMAYFKTWFADSNYQLIVLAYGTNEGNNKPFDAAAYRQTLARSVAQMKSVFPATPCLLLGPGDRGILIRKSSATKIKKKKPGPRPDLFVYSRIHAQINAIQREVANQNACQAWNMQDAMGGPDSAYRWASMRPPLMAGDLIHFTIPGYERLAQKLAQDMDWRPETIWLGR